jgi:hypothetical protein
MKIDEYGADLQDRLKQIHELAESQFTHSGIVMGECTNQCDGCKVIIKQIKELSQI